MSVNSELKATKIILLDRERCTYSSSNLFGQKSVLTWNYKFLKTLIHIEKARECIINVYMVIQFSFTGSKVYIK